MTDYEKYDKLREADEQKNRVKGGSYLAKREGKRIITKRPMSIRGERSEIGTRLEGRWC